MSIDLPEAHARALDRTRDFVAGVRADRWAEPTPCEGWDVRTLVNHIVAGNWWAEALGSGSTIEAVGDRLDGDVLGDDPVAAYDASAAAAAAVFRRPGAMEAPCAVSYGPVPGEVYCGHRFVDVLIHGWDVARGSGQDATLDPELLAVCRAVLEPQIDLLRGSGMFGGDVSVPAGASEQTVVLAMLGRQG